MTEDTDNPDDGPVAGADDLAIDPWGSSTIEDYRSLFEEFGIEEFDEVLADVPNPHYLMRRAIIFGHRDYRRVVEAMATDGPFAALSGFMPTGDPHIGHKLVFDELIWHQQQGGDTYALIADLEAHSARGLSWDEIDDHAEDYLLSLLAFGFDPEAGTLYRQSTNRRLQDLAFELGIKANFSEFEAIYGFSGETDVSHMQSVVTQAADILYPQLDEPKPTVIPVGPDQDPHIRLTRDLASRMRYFGVTRAYASYEVTDYMREYIRWIHEEVERGFEEGLEMTTHGPLANINNSQAAILSQSLEEFLTSSDKEIPANPSELDIDYGELSELDNYDHTETEWEIVVNEFLSSLSSAPPDVSNDLMNALLRRFKSAKNEPLRPRVRFLDLNATKDAFDNLIEEIPGEKRVYDEHIDAFEMGREEAEALARKIEVEHGGNGFIPPSSIYHRFMTGLTGGKMSSSVPASHISLLDDPEDGYDKVRAATTGGRETADEQRELGGRPDECPVYELYAYLLAGDDDEYAETVYDECAGGERLCGGCKTEAAEGMVDFLETHQERREEMRDVLDDLDVELDLQRP